MSEVESRLAAHGMTVPAVAAPVAAYIPAVRTGNLVFTSGQLPMVAGEVSVVGIVGDGVDQETAQRAAGVCALNAIAAVKSLIGDLDKVIRVVKVVGFVASHPTFTNQPVVINGASEVLAQAFGDAGVHARSAVGVAALPRNAAVEVEIIVEVRD
jgi:enamine deaminase RidA (YjgF/YER057c/UK114 family)